MVTFVAVGSKLYYSKRWRYFADFLADYMKMILGSEWGNAEYRVYFLWMDRDLAVLLLGGDKSTQRQDIERARELARELVKGGNA